MLPASFIWVQSVNSNRSAEPVEGLSDDHPDLRVGSVRECHKEVWLCELGESCRFKYLLKVKDCFTRHARLGLVCLVQLEQDRQRVSELQ